MRRPSLSLLVLFWLPHTVLAQFELSPSTPATEASLVSEAKTIAAGATFSVALNLDHPAGWHSYYLNSGGVEQSPAITWNLPEGFSAGPIQWPVPEVKEGFFGKSFIHSGNPVFLTDITAPATLKPGATVTFSADATWQICEESCVNESKSFSFTLPVGTSLEKDPSAASLFAKARASLPAKPHNWKISAQSDGRDILLRLQPDTPLEGAPTDFIPDQTFAKSASDGGSIQRDGDAWMIRLKRATKDALDQDIPQGNAISGILAGPSPFAIPETVITSPPPMSMPRSKFFSVIGGMFLGGLILNLMPCVFPVIGLKILGFVQQAGENRRKVAMHGVSFTLGVLLSFGVLSGALFAARAAAQGGDNAIGWGYQLQNPWVILALMLLMFVIALNLFGVFEVGASATSVGGSLQSKKGYAGSFFSGVLATIVATPCSAPFLGVAIGAAIALPAAKFFAAFGAMAMGLALPYLVLSVFPRLIDFLPRPGAWMEHFKQAMSFLLFATAGYLLWVYAGLIGLENLLAPLLGLCAIAVAAWIHGRWNLPHHRRPKRLIALAFTLLFAIGGFVLTKPPKPSALTWETWSQERVEALLDEGKSVYIDFTAQWCATCQVNKKRAYTPEVIALMKKKGVVALKADKTKPNPEIEAALERLGRSAIPVNVLLAPGKEPVILSELLSPKEVIAALENL